MNRAREFIDINNEYAIILSSEIASIETRSGVVTADGVIIGRNDYVCITLKSGKEYYIKGDYTDTKRWWVSCI